jgi:hypothetical protein
MRDIVVVTTVVLAFAALITAHVAIVAGLVARPPRWRALVAFALPPAALFWAWNERMRVRACVWVGALVLYAVARVLAGL